MPSVHPKPPKNLKNKSFVAYEVTPKDHLKLMAYLCSHRLKNDIPVKNGSGLMRKV